MGLLAGSSLWGMVTVVATVGSQVLLVAYGSSKLLPGKQSDFILEIPPLRMPRWSNLLRKTALRVRWFFGEALPFFVFGAVLLFFLDRWGWLQKITAAGQPIVVDWLGLPADAATALLMGFLRRDYGAAGLFALARAGQLDAVQVVVAAVTLTLFLPCLANLLMIVKEFGGRAATAMALFVIPFALFVGGVLNHLLRWLLPALGFS
jgi:ferrous iron transport protein B